MPNLDLLDANVIVRYLVGDTPELASRATGLIESSRHLYIPVVILSEVGFVLTQVYKIERARVVDALLDLLGRHNIDPLEIAKDKAIEALQLCAPSSRVSFADAMLWAVAHREVGTVWTFDKRFPAVGIQVNEP